jgi:hypothetical protein
MNKNDENELESNPNSDSNTSDEIVNNNKLDEQNNLLQSAKGCSHIGLFGSHSIHIRVE